jgi:hypothetical protein
MCRPMGVTKSAAPEPEGPSPCTQEPTTGPYPEPTESTAPPPPLKLMSLIAILIPCSHLPLGLPSGLFPSGFPTKTLKTSLYSSMSSTCAAHLILLDPRSKSHPFSMPMSCLKSVQVRYSVEHFVTAWFSTGRVVSSPSNPQGEILPPVGCPLLLIQYIRSYPPYLEAVFYICNLRTRHAVVTRDPLTMDVLTCLYQACNKLQHSEVVISLRFISHTQQFLELTLLTRVDKEHLYDASQRYSDDVKTFTVVASTLGQTGRWRRTQRFLRDIVRLAQDWWRWERVRDIVDDAGYNNW